LSSLSGVMSLNGQRRSHMAWELVASGINHPTSIHNH
jgi:hypothetical protein